MTFQRVAPFACALFGFAFIAYYSEPSCRGPECISSGAEAASRSEASVRSLMANGNLNRIAAEIQSESDDRLEPYIRPDRWSGIEGAIEITNPYVVKTPPKGAVLASVYWGQKESYEPIDLPSMEPSTSPLIYANFNSGGSPQQIADRIDAENRQRLANELSSRGIEVKWEDKSYDDLLKLLKAM